ncbi:MAG: SCO family protein [Desulfocapsaceae bacterium]|nr:SCO family protein [Desulfocapsaceae bacterium]
MMRISCRKILTGCGICYLILVFFPGMPGAAAAHEGHQGAASGNAVLEKAEAVPQVADQDWVEEKTGDYLPLDTRFTDAAGNTVSLRAIINRPTLILPIYFYCPNSCSLNLSYLADAIKSSSLKPLADFQVIAFSFNPDETVADASNARGNYLKLLPENFPADAWTFLVGSNESVKALTDATGFRYKRMADGTFVHPSALIVVSAEGRIIKYVYGSFLPGDVDMALLEAIKGVPSQSVKRLLGFCFNNDTQRTDVILTKVKIGLVLGSLVLGGLFLLFLRRSKKRNQTGEGQE